MHGASPAKPCTASELGARQTKIVPQDPQKRCIAGDDDGLLPAVDGQGVGHHVPSPNEYEWSIAECPALPIQSRQDADYAVFAGAHVGIFSINDRFTHVYFHF